jgi:hypothetical protein
LQHQLAALAVQADGLVADLADQEHALPRRFIHGQGQLVLGPGRFQGFAHLALDPKEAVGRHGVVQALVRAEMVVMVHPEREPFLGVVKFERLHPAPELLTHGLPKAFALAQGLGMMGSGNDVPDALAVQEGLEAALAPPSEILPALVREEFQGLPEALDAFQERLLDELGRLLHAQFPGHDVAAVVVHEGHQVHALAVPRQQEAGDVRLPELAGPGPFKTPDDGLLLPFFRG